MPGFTDDSGVRAASRPDLREGKGALEALGEGDGAIRRRRAAGMPSVPLDEAAPRAGHDVRICRAFVTLSGYVPGHSIRAAPAIELAPSRGSELSLTARSRAPARGDRECSFAPGAPVSLPGRRLPLSALALATERIVASAPARPGCRANEGRRHGGSRCSRQHKRSV